MSGPLILAIDPGSSRCAYAVLQGEVARVRYVASGFFDAELDGFLAVLGGSAFNVVAVERPAGYVHEAARGANLMATAGVAYAIDWVARSRAIPTVTLTAAEVRKGVLGRSTQAFGRAQEKGGMDRIIKAAIATFVDGLPRQTNNHVRDALLVGVAANWITLGRAQKRTEAGK